MVRSCSNTKTLFVASLRQIDGLKEICMTTNGLVLTRKLVALQRAGLDKLNISLDTLIADRFEHVTRRKGWDRVMMGIDLALQLGYNPVKVNCVVVRGFNDDEICNFVKLTENKNVDIRFIEYMPFGGNKWEMQKMISFQDMVNRIKSTWSDFRPIENQPNDTSKVFYLKMIHLRTLRCHTIK